MKNYIAKTKSRGGDVAREEFVGDYSVPGIITQYLGLLLSTRDYHSLSGIITQYQGLLLSGALC